MPPPGDRPPGYPTDKPWPPVHWPLESTALPAPLPTAAVPSQASPRIDQIRRP